MAGLPHPRSAAHDRWSRAAGECLGIPETLRGDIFEISVSAERDDRVDGWDDGDDRDTKVVTVVLRRRLSRAEYRRLMEAVVLPDREVSAP